MATNLNGKWGIKLRHNFDDDVVIPVTLYYNQKNPISVNVTKTLQSVTTAWETPIGTKLDTSLITVDSKPLYSLDGRKKYVINTLSLNLQPYIVKVTNKIVFKPTSYTTPDSEGETNFVIYYVTYYDNVETKRINVTSTAKITSNNTALAEIDGYGIKYHNSGTTQKQTTIKATYNGETGSAVLKVKGRTTTKNGILLFSGNVNDVTITINGEETYQYTGGTQQVGVFADGATVSYALSKTGYQPITGSIIIVGNDEGTQENLIEFTMTESSMTLTAHGDLTQKNT